MSLAGFPIVFRRAVFFEAESLVGKGIPIFAIEGNISVTVGESVCLECVSKMPEAHLAGNSVAVTASLPAFLR